jgi:hypothetical protein
MQYIQDHDEKYPIVEIRPGGNVSWMQMIYPYAKSTQVFACPSNTDTAGISTWLSNPAPSGFANPFHTIYIANARTSYAGSGTTLSLASVQSVSTTIYASDGGAQAVNPAGANGHVFPQSPQKPTAWLLIDLNGTP